MKSISSMVDILPWKKEYKGIMWKAILYKKEFCYNIKNIYRARLYTDRWFYRVLYYNWDFYAEVYNYDWYIQLQMIDFKRWKDFSIKEE